MFTIDHSQASSGELPEGEYECIVRYAGESVTTYNKTPYINVTLVVRNDVKQSCQNQSIRHSIWHKKEPSQADLSCGGYSFKQIQTLSKALGLQDGKSYENLEDWCDDLTNKPVRITVEKETYEGKTHSRVKWLNETKTKDCHHVWKDEEPDDDTPADKKSEKFEEVKTQSDDDLPF